MVDEILLAKLDKNIYNQGSSVKPCIFLWLLQLSIAPFQLENRWLDMSFFENYRAGHVKMSLRETRVK